MSLKKIMDMQEQKPLVSIVVGSVSDWDTMKNCADMLENFGIPYERNAASAHRTPEKAVSIAAEARGRGIKVLIAAAGEPRIWPERSRRTRSFRL